MTSRVEPLRLDRMAVEEVGSNPERLAAAIHDQIAIKQGSVPVEAIARALDIAEIRRAETRGLEGALVAPPERGYGAILVNGRASPTRQRFTIAHELGHFLNIYHKPRHPGGFACTAGDLKIPWNMRPGNVLADRMQEAQANRFAIELLAPAHLMVSGLRGIADLDAVLTLARTLEISREACARRWVELREGAVAVVFSKEGMVRYTERGAGFPFVNLRPGDRLPAVPAAAGSEGLSIHEEADSREWLAGPRCNTLVIQTLHQREGFTMTLLAFDETDPPETDDGTGRE